MSLDNKYLRYGLIVACVLLALVVAINLGKPQADEGKGVATEAAPVETTVDEQEPAKEDDAKESDEAKKADASQASDAAKAQSKQESDEAKASAKAQDATAKKKVRTPKTEAARTAVRQLLEGYDTSVAVSMVPLDGTQGFGVNNKKQFVSASMIKLLVLATLMDQAQAGNVKLDATYTLNAADIVGGAGHINEFALGTEFSYDQVAESMIAYSDNTAANVLIDLLGMDAINAEAAKLGLEATHIGRKMMDLSGTSENYMSTRDAAVILRGFAEGKIASKELSDKAMHYLVQQTDNDALARGIPSGVTFAHKTGSLTMIRHDGGVVLADEPYVLVVFTELYDGEANELMARISQAVYEATQG